MAKLFIVDDEPIFQEMLGDYLEDVTEYEIVKLNSGEECLANIHQNPEIIILDHNFGLAGQNALNGEETLRRIKKELPNVRVIMLTGSEDSELFSKMINDGAEDFIPKNDDTFDALAEIL